MYKKKIVQSIFLIVGITSLLEATPPNAPGPYVGVSKIKDLNNSVRLSFMDNSNDENGFNISVYNNENDTLFKNININSSNNGYGYANITSLSCDKTYRVSVNAYNEDGNSTSSDSAFFQIKSTFGVPCYNNSNVEIPNAPGDYIGITDINETAVRVSFLDNSDDEDGFIVYGEGINAKVSKNDETKHPFQYVTLSNLSCNKNYDIKALAYNSEGNSSSSSSRQFNIQNTFGVTCSNTPPKVKLSITYRNMSGNYSDYRFFEVYVETTDIDGEVVNCQWGDNADCEVHNNYIMGRGAEYEDYRNKIFSITVTDNDGATATDSVKIYDEWYEGKVNDVIYIDTIPNILKVGQTALINAYVNNIIPRTSCGTSVTGHSWGSSNGLVSFNDDLFEIGHFICYGYRASTKLTATQKGDTTITLSSGISSKSFSIQIVEANNTKDSTTKIVTDNITGLMWVDNTAPLKPFVTESNYQAFREWDYSGDTAKTYCETLEWGGYDDWRLPTLFEVTGYIPQDSENEYWSSTKIPEERDNFFMLSSKVLSTHKNKELSVICVRN